MCIRDRVQPGSRAKFVGTGKPDIYIVRGEKALVIDHKSGWGDVIPSHANPQLRMNAVLVWMAHPEVIEVTVVIIQPRGKPEIAVLDNAGLVAAKEWLDDVLYNERQATAEDRCAGDWCEYCPCAELGCPTQMAKLKETMKPLELDRLPEKKKEAIFARLMELPSEELLRLDEARGLMELACASIPGAIRMRYDAGDPVIKQNYQLEPGVERRKITDAAAAYEALQPLGVTLEDFWAAVEPKVGSLDAAVQMRSGKRTKKDGSESNHYVLSQLEAKKKLTDALLAAGALEYKESQQTLKRIKLIEA